MELHKERKRPRVKSVDIPPLEPNPLQTPILVPVEPKTTPTERDRKGLVGRRPKTSSGRDWNKRRGPTLYTSVLRKVRVSSVDQLDDQSPRDLPKLSQDLTDDRTLQERTLLMLPKVEDPVGERVNRSAEDLWQTLFP